MVSFSAVSPGLRNSRCPVSLWGQPEDCGMGALPSSGGPRGCSGKAGVAQGSQARPRQACAHARVGRQERAAGRCAREKAKREDQAYSPWRGAILLVLEACQRTRGTDEPFSRGRAVAASLAGDVNASSRTHTHMCVPRRCLESVRRK